MANLPAINGNNANIFLSAEGSGSDADPQIVRHFAIGKRVIQSFAFTRPADTTAYTAGDVLGDGTVGILTNCARILGGSGVLNSIMAVVGANQSPAPALTAWVFAVAPTADADNAPFTPTDSELSGGKLVGVFSLTNEIGDLTSGAGGNLIAQWSGARPFKCAVGSDDLFVVLQVGNAYVPTSAETYDVSVVIAQD